MTGSTATTPPRSGSLTDAVTRPDTPPVRTSTLTPLPQDERPAAIAAPRPDLPDRGGAATIAFALRDGRTRLADLGQRTPLRVLFPTPPPDDIPTAAIMNTGGGLVAGDHVDVAVEVGAGARALVMAGAAEKVYRSPGPTARTRVETALRVAPGAWLEWLPQETILFAESRLTRRLRLDVAGDGRALAGEILVLGRLARGERARSGLVRDAIEVRRDGRLAWADALHLEGDYGPVIDSRSGLGGAVALATLIHVAPDAARHVEVARAILDAVSGLGTGIASDGTTDVASLGAGTAVPGRTGPVSDVAIAVLTPGSVASDVGPARKQHAVDAGPSAATVRPVRAGAAPAGAGIGTSPPPAGAGAVPPGTIPGRRVPTTAVYAGSSPAPSGLRTGVTCVNGVLVARWLADDPRRLRASFGAFWARMRHELAGLPAKLPRLWEV